MGHAVGRPRSTDAHRVVSLESEVGGSAEGGTSKFDGKVALVTGGGSGIGEAICMALASEGARVAVLDVNREAADLTAGLLAKGYGVGADVSDSAAVDRAVQDVESVFGPLDILVNNAGIVGQTNIARIGPRAEQQMAEAASGGPVATSLDASVELSDDEWRQMIGVHLDGTFYCT